MCEKLNQVDTKNYINYSKSTKTTYCFIDISASRRKPLSGLTSGAGRQYKAGRLIREVIWIRKTDNMNQDEGRELPVEPRMGQAFTYWRPAPEVSPDEGFRREAETSIKTVCCFGWFRVINIVISNVDNVELNIIFACVC